MQYQNVKFGIFESRPNRFIANIQQDGESIVCHVKNTGRCGELLIPGAKVAVEESANPKRKTRYDLVSVEKAGRWVNIDSQIPNLIVEQWIASSGFFSEKCQICREKKYGKSRFDLYVQDGERRAFVEVNGVTLEEDGVARFPDAPTLRGIKHLEELIQCLSDGYEAYLIFLIQLKGVHYLEPNWKTHRGFGETLLRAKRAGVKILAYDCQVEPDKIFIDQPVPVVMGGE